VSAADQYNTDTYVRDINFATREAFFDGPVRVGEMAPDFDLPLVDGGRARLADLRAKGHVALIFGCFTAPPCVAQLPAIEALHRTYGGRGFSFLFVYTREIHPGENLPPHRTIDQKIEQARRMRDYARITFPIGADDLEGSVHIAYGGLPSMVAVIHRAGQLVYRGSWTQSEMLHPVLENLLLRDRDEGKGTGRLAYHEWLAYMERESSEHWRIVDLAGPKARSDYERANASPAEQPGRGALY